MLMYWRIAEHRFSPEWPLFATVKRRQFRKCRVFVQGRCIGVNRVDHVVYLECDKDHVVYLECNKDHVVYLECGNADVVGG